MLHGVATVVFYTAQCVVQHCSNRELSELIRCNNMAKHLDYQALLFETRLASLINCVLCEMNCEYPDNWGSKL